MSTRSLLCLFALVTLTTVARAQPVARLWSITVERYTDQPDGSVLWEVGALNARGEYRRDPYTVPITINFLMPEPMRNRPVIQQSAWENSGRFGGALANFEIVPTGLGPGFRLVAGTFYGAVAAREDAVTAVGHVVNLSSRVTLAAGDAPAIAGFVVSGESRRVLIRGIGPALAALGVTDAATDPFLAIYRGQTPIYFNDDWGTRHDAAEIAAVAARVGAFPLAAGSRDAALLVELPPGPYTVQLRAGEGKPGTGLIEIYLLDPYAP